MTDNSRGEAVGYPARCGSRDQIEGGLTYVIPPCTFCSVDPTIIPVIYGSKKGDHSYPAWVYEIRELLRMDGHSGLGLALTNFGQLPDEFLPCGRIRAEVDSFHPEEQTPTKTNRCGFSYLPRRTH